MKSHTCRQFLKTFSITLLGLAIPWLQAGTPDDANNLIPNPDFNGPLGSEIFLRGALFQNNGGRDNSSCVRIDNGTNTAANHYVSVSLRPTNHGLREDRLYTLTAWVFLSNVPAPASGNGAFLKVEGYSNATNVWNAVSSSFEGGSSGWRKLSLTTKLGKNLSSVNLLFRLRGPGMIFVDRVKFSYHLFDNPTLSGGAFPGQISPVTYSTGFYSNTGFCTNPTFSPGHALFLSNLDGAFVNPYVCLPVKLTNVPLLGDRRLTFKLMARTEGFVSGSKFKLKIETYVKGTNLLESSAYSGFETGDVIEGNTTNWVPLRVSVDLPPLPIDQINFYARIFGKGIVVIDDLDAYFDDWENHNSRIESLVVYADSLGSGAAKIQFNLKSNADLSRYGAVYRLRDDESSTFNFYDNSANPFTMYERSREFTVPLSLKPGSNYRYFQCERFLVDSTGAVVGKTNQPMLLTKRPTDITGTGAASVFRHPATGNPHFPVKFYHIPTTAYLTNGLGINGVQGLANFVDTDLNAASNQIVVGKPLYGGMRILSNLANGNIANYVAAHRDHQTLGYYMLYDEPDGNGEPVENLVRLRKEIAARDIKHFSYMVMAYNFSIFNFQGPADVVVVDPYPKKAAPYKPYPLAMVRDYINTRLIQRLEGEHATALWVYAPGLFSGGAQNTSNVAKLTGFAVTRFSNQGTLCTVLPSPHPLARGLAGSVYGNPGLIGGSYLPPSFSGTTFFCPTNGAMTVLATNQKGGAALAVIEMNPGSATRWTSVYSSSPLLSAPLFRNLIRSAGGFLYTTNATTGVSANDRYVSIFSKEGGPTDLFLKKSTRLVDALGGQTLGTATNFVLSMRSNEARIFSLE